MMTVDDGTSMLPLSVETNCDARRLRVVEIDFLSDDRWQSFVDTHPEGLIYHHSLWLRALQGEYGQKSMALACEDHTGRIRGLMPLLRTRGLPFNWGTQVLGPRLSSLPRTGMAGPLSIDSQATAALLNAAKERVKKEPGTRLQLKVWAKALDDVVEDVVGIPWQFTYVLELPEQSQALRFGNSRNHGRIKWAVQRAAKAGVEVRPAKTEAELQAWYKLFLDTMRWHAVPPRPYRFFKACWETMRPRGLMRLLLAVQHQAGSSRLLAGSIFFMFNRTVCYSFSGRDREYLSLRPNDAIQWRAIHDAHRDGYRRFDFGEVPGENEGLADFKTKWGAEPRQVYRYYYPALAETESGDSQPGGARRIAEAAWRRLPLKATGLLGDWIYGYL
jgi:hypothetical protein